MADITKCIGKTEDGFVCAIRDKCYRYTAPHNEYRQSYGPPAPDFKPETGCNFHYIRG